MRYISSEPSKFGTKLVMLVDNPHDQRFKEGVLCCMFRGDEDGAPESVHFYDGFTIDQTMDELEDACGIKRSDWSRIADQVSGCLDEWIAPVRIARNEEGEQISGMLEILVGDQWIPHIPKNRR